MPILVKDYTWRETEGEVELRLPLKGAKPSGVDVFTTEQYIKVNYPPFLFEVQLFAPVAEEKCTVRIGNGVVLFRLVKKTPGIWSKLAELEGEEKSAMSEKRSEAVAQAHRKAAEEREEKTKKKKKEETFAINKQIKLEQEERARIEAVKQVCAGERLEYLLQPTCSCTNLQLQRELMYINTQIHQLLQEERDKATEDIDRWNKEKAAGAVKAQARHSTLGPRISPKDIFTDKPVQPAAPPRKGGKIAVHFTPRQFVTAARESTALQEEEWLTKMAAARKIKPPETDDESANDRNPEFLKDKGIAFFKAGNYEAAINVFSQAINLNKSLPHLYLNRAACYLSLGDNERCVKDCCIALELLFPVVPANYTARTKVFVRRGTAYANMGELELALQDYDGARKLSPDNDRLREDYERIKQALLAT